jgi:hypothetical protein
MENPQPRWVKRYAWDNTFYPQYTSPAALELKKQWKAELEAALDDPERFSAINRRHPDDTIHALLNPSILDLDAEKLSDPLNRWAA